MDQVLVEEVDHQGQRLWRVRVGRRALTFSEEMAARSFAAQLHLRLEWLRQQR